MSLKIDYLLFRIRKVLWDKMKQAGIIRKRPIFDAGGIHKTFYGQKVLSAYDGNDYIFECLLNDVPCLIGRIGTTEMGVYANCIGVELGIQRHIKTKTKNDLCTYSGFFPINPSDQMMMQWSKIYSDSLLVVDGFATFDTHSEDYVVNRYCSNAVLMQLLSLEPYFFNSPWSRALKGKKVLVIHPFEDTIRKQYQYHEHLFQNKDVLPDFELKTIKAVQSVAGESTQFSSWFEALDYMKRQIDACDFDVAIIGCGAYALPLGAYVKQIGKKAVIMAGPTQLLFGIMGSRWEKSGIMKDYVNDFWTKPGENERPKNANKVEGACYW